MSETILHTESLALTLWQLEKSRLNGSELPQDMVKEAMDWIIKRQKEPGRYGLGFAAPTEVDYKSSKLPTGEKLHSRAGTAHLLGEESFWALCKWGGPEMPGVKKGLIGMLGRARRFPASSDRGQYCCKTCSLALWRALAASGLEEGQPFLERGLSTMSISRDGKLGWVNFPFGYTVFSLASLDHPMADKELEYAAGRIERALRRLRTTQDPYGLRKLGYKAALERI